MSSERADLGPAFGPELTGAEVRYLMAREWARFGELVLGRGNYHGKQIVPASLLGQATVHK